MASCPACSGENLPGADVCGRCGQSLAAVPARPPKSPLEVSLTTDTLAVLPPQSPVEVGPATSVAQTLARMVERGVGCVLVVEAGRMVGLFSERDALVRLTGDRAAWADEPIARYMTTQPARIKLDDTIALALHNMDVGGYRHLPVMEGERAIGVVSIRDILRYLTERLAAESMEGLA